MTDATRDAAARSLPDEEPVFAAHLSPHRSLSKNGFTILMIMTGGVLFVQGVFFFFTGAWPVVTFLGLDLLALYIAFKLNYRAGRAAEEVCVWRSDLLIRKIAPSGRKTDHHYNPFWARFDVDRHKEIGITRMAVSGEGRSTAIGQFLNPDDRESFADAFSHALAAARR